MVVSFMLVGVAIKAIAIGAGIIGSIHGRIYWNGCTENFHFAFRRCGWLHQLRDYAASNKIFV